MIICILQIWPKCNLRAQLQSCFPISKYFQVYLGCLLCILSKLGPPYEVLLFFPSLVCSSSFGRTQTHLTLVFSQHCCYFLWPLLLVHDCPHVLLHSGGNNSLFGLHSCCEFSPPYRLGMGNWPTLSQSRLFPGIFEHWELWFLKL